MPDTAFGLQEKSDCTEYFRYLPQTQRVALQYAVVWALRAKGDDLAVWEASFSADRGRRGVLPPAVQIGETTEEDREEGLY